MKKHIQKIKDRIKKMFSGECSHKYRKAPEKTKNIIRDNRTVGQRVYHVCYKCGDTKFEDLMY